MEFNTDQIEVLKLDSGWHSCLAAAGSGKTEVLTERVSKAIETGIDPKNILCLTFTNRSARSMIERVEQRLGERAEGVFIGNIHAFSLKFIEKNRLISNVNALADPEVADKLWSIAQQETLNLLKLGYSAVNDQINNVLSKIVSLYDSRIEINNKQVEQALYAFQQSESYKKWNLRGISSLVLPLVSPISSKLDQSFIEFVKEKLIVFDSNISEGNLFFALGLALYTSQKYSELKEELNLFDFDDVLVQTLVSLVEGTHSNKMYHYQWCQIDEVQDISPIQWLIIENLLSPDSHVVLFGDIRQSIYRFMGASIEITEHHLGESRLELNVNYRSPSNLVEMANEYCQAHFNFNQQKARAYKPARPAALIHVQRFSVEEHDNVLVRHAKKLAENNRAVAFLLSTNNQVSKYSSLLNAQGIEHFSIQNQDLLSSQYALDFMAFLKVIYEPRSRLALSRLFWRFGHLSQLNPQTQDHDEPQIAAMRLAAKLGNLGCELSDFLGGENCFDYFLSRFVNSVHHEEITYFDTETTGLDPQSDAIIQLAGAKTLDGAFTDVIDLYCKTDKPLGNSVDIHHITPDILVMKGKRVTEQLERFLSFTSRSILVAHNLPFDDAMLKQHIKKWLPQNYEQYLNLTKYCSLEISKRLFPDLQSYKLGQLLLTFNLQGLNSHNALDDVKAGMNLMMHLAGEAQRRLEHINAIVSPFSKAIDRFNHSFSPLWGKIELIRNNEQLISMSDLIDLYFDFVRDNNSYPLLEHSKELELKKKLGRHADAHFPRLSIDEYLKECMPFYQTAKESDLITEQDKVVVSTIHRSKGLEFEHVILPMMVDGVIPSFNVTKQLQHISPRVRDEANKLLEEQKRLTYVALTRAKEQLIIGTFSDQNGYAKSICPFLDPVIEMFQVY